MTFYYLRKPVTVDPVQLTISARIMYNCLIMDQSALVIAIILLIIFGLFLNFIDSNKKTSLLEINKPYLLEINTPYDQFNNLNTTNLSLSPHSLISVFNNLNTTNLSLTDELIDRVLMYLNKLNTLCLSIKNQDSFFKNKETYFYYNYLIGSAHLYRILKILDFKEKDIEKVVFDFHRLFFSGVDENTEQEAFNKFLSNTKQFFQYYYNKESLLIYQNFSTYILMDMFKMDLNEENFNLINVLTKHDFKIKHDKIFSELVSNLVHSKSSDIRNHIEFSGRVAIDLIAQLMNEAFSKLRNSLKTTDGIELSNQINIKGCLALIIYYFNSFMLEKELAYAFIDIVNYGFLMKLPSSIINENEYIDVLELSAQVKRSFLNLNEKGFDREKEMIRYGFIFLNFLYDLKLDKLLLKDEYAGSDMSSLPSFRSQITATAIVADINSFYKAKTFETFDSDLFKKSYERTDLDQYESYFNELQVN